METQKYYDCLISDNGGDLGVQTLDEAYTFCEKLAKQHYENFPVGSILVSKRLRKYFFAIYAYCRIADDLGDEYPADTATKLQNIDKFESLLEKDMTNLSQANPIFLALQDTIRNKNIPLSPFKNLLEAFRRDCNFSLYSSKEELLKYCKYSANPVGELVLYLFDNYNTESAKYSDMICSALQLANFWQDISVDKKNMRCYIPKEFLCPNHANHVGEIGIKEFLAYLDKPQNQQDFTYCLDEIYLWTENLFNEGKKILPTLKNPRLKLELRAIISGGKSILRASQKQGLNIYHKRPKINKLNIVLNFFRV